MTDCGEARVLVEKLSDGEATADEKRAAESHLGECTSCRSHLEFLLSLTEEARSMTFPEPPESYWEHLPRRVLDRIDSERGERPRGEFWSGLLAPAMLRWGALGATLLVLVTVGVAVLREDARPLAPPPPAASIEQSPAQARAATEPSAAEPTAPPPMARDEAAPSRAKVSSEAVSRVAEPAIPEAFAPAAPAETANAVEAQRVAQDEVELRKENAPALAGASRPRAAAARATLSREAATENCDELRRVVAAMDDGPDRNDARYHLATCSLDRHERKESEELRKLAIEDAERFLSVEGQGPRADEIRGRLDRLRPDGRF